MPKPNGPQFSYIAPQGENEHRVVATAKDPFGKMNMGSLEWNQQGEITNIYVPPQYRRKGIATKMYRFAQEGVKSGQIDAYSPEHAHGRTDEGELWAKSLGEPLPKREPL